MTLSQFVQQGRVGTLAQRERFETGLVEAHERAIAAGVPPPGKWAIDMDCDEDLWVLAFGTVREGMRIFGITS